MRGKVAPDGFHRLLCRGCGAVPMEEPQLEVGLPSEQGEHRTESAVHIVRGLIDLLIESKSVASGLGNSIARAL